MIFNTKKNKNSKKTQNKFKKHTKTTTNKTTKKKQNNKKQTHNDGLEQPSARQMYFQMKFFHENTEVFP